MHSTATESHRFVDTDPDAMVMSLQDAIVDGFCTGNRQVGRYTYTVRMDSSFGRTRTADEGLMKICIPHSL
jgi:hypothetical protein